MDPSRQPHGSAGDRLEGVLLDGVVPWGHVAAGLAYGATLAAAGHAVYRRLSGRIAELV